MLETKILLLGVDGVGKTSLLYKLKFDEEISPIPTIGYNFENINYKDRKFSIMDLGGGIKIRNFWKNYFEEQKCLIYMIDLSSKNRLDEYIECFQFVLDIHKNYRNIPIIIFCNKFNDKEEFEPEELFNKVNIPPEISQTILKGNIIKGEGKNELLEYIYSNIQFEEGKEEEEKEEDNIETTKKKEEYKVCMLGLNDSGKTLILYLLRLGEKVQTIPTIGYNVENIINNNWEKDIAIWDIGGQQKLRALWVHFLDLVNGLIWVYDISDEKLMEENKNELINVLTLPKIKENLPLLIYANKSDLNENGNKPETFLNGIQEYIKNRPYFIQVCNANDIESYKNGLSWLYNNFNPQ